MTSQQAQPHRIGTQVVSAGPQARNTIQSAEAAPAQTGISRIAIKSLSHFTAADYSRKVLAVKCCLRVLVRRTPVMGAKEVRDRSPREELNTASPDKLVVSTPPPFAKYYFAQKRIFF